MSAEIEIPVLDDPFVEFDENVIVTLEAITSGDSDLELSVAADAATATILSDDVADAKMQVARSQ